MTWLGICFGLVVVSILLALDVIYRLKQCLYEDSKAFNSLNLLMTVQLILGILIVVVLLIPDLVVPDLFY